MRVARLTIAIQSKNCLLISFFNITNESQNAEVKRGLKHARTCLSGVHKLTRCPFLTQNTSTTLKVNSSK